MHPPSRPVEAVYGGGCTRVMGVRVTVRTVVCTRVQCPGRSITLKHGKTLKSVNTDTRVQWYTRNRHSVTPSQTQCHTESDTVCHIEVTVRHIVVTVRHIVVTVSLMVSQCH